MPLFRKLDQQAADLLQALARGATLKAHRDIDGGKVHRLHALDGTVRRVPAASVRALERRHLVASNQKFPAATYLLTEKGRRRAERWIGTAVRPLSARNYLRD